MKQENKIRKPTQERSKKRVDAILKAAKELIGEKGSSNLKIHDIAERAGIYTATIYQYFPNKTAIVIALADHLFEQMTEAYGGMVQETESEQQAFGVLSGMVEAQYQFYLNEPVLYNVWTSVSAEKISDMDLQDSSINGEVAFDLLKEYYDERSWERLAKVCFMLTHLSGAAVRMAFILGETEGRDVVDNFKGLLNRTVFEKMLNSNEGID